jgi:OPA family glycerol-3-phosphate transporter-like MFS transporter
VGANFLAAAVAATTLGLFDHNWRSQLFIMAGAAIVGAVIVALTLQDLAPEVRRKVRITEEVEHAPVAPAVRRQLRLLLQRPVYWAHVGAMSFLYILLATMNAYGQTMLVSQFQVSVRAASAIAMTFWLANLSVSLVFARFSDRSQHRKPYLVWGGVSASVLLGAFVLLMGQGAVAPTFLVVALFIGVGVALGAVFGPWMASLSEYSEEIHPDIQGLAFGFSHLMTRLFILAAVLMAPRVVAASDWRTWMTVTFVGTVAFAGIATRVQGSLRPRLVADDVAAEVQHDLDTRAVQ